MAQFDADILLNVKTNQRSLDRVAATVGRINSLAKQIKPINLFAPGAGAGADQVRTSMEVILKRAAAISKIGSGQISATYAGAAQTADAFAEVLRNVNIQARNGNVALEQQDQRVQNLAGAYAQAAAKAELLSDRYAEIIRQARQAQGLAIGPVSALGTVGSDSAAAESRAQAAAQQQSAKNLRTDLLYQRLRLQLLKNQSAELLKQDSLLARLANKAAQLGGGGKLGESLALGVGFPLLFGAGPGSILGSALGSFVGQGFGGQILGGGIGQVLDQAVQRAIDLGNAVREVDLQKLSDSGIQITRELEQQVVLYRQVGDAVAAQAVVAEQVAIQTGVFAEAQQDIANSGNLLTGTWGNFSATVSNTIGLLSAPFTAALSGILGLTSGILKTFNFVISGIGLGVKRAAELAIEFAFGSDALENINAWMSLFNGKLDESNSKASDLINTLSTKLSTTSIDLGVAQNLRLGDTAADKTANAQLKAQADLDKLRVAYLEDQRNLALQLSELGKDGYETALNTLKSNYDTNKQLIKQKAANDAIVISNRENERLTRLSGQNRKKEAAELLKIQVLQAQLNTSTALLGIDKQIATAQVDGDKAKLAELEYTRALEASELKIAEIRARGISEAETQRRIKLEENRLEKELLDIDTKRALERKKLEKSFQTTVDGLTIELGLAQAVTREEENRLKLQQKRLSLQGNGLNDDQINQILALEGRLQAAQAPIQQYMTQLQKSLNDVDAQIVRMAQTIETELGSAMSSAITGVITGTQTVEQAMASMFENIGKAFIDMATQMLAQQLILSVLKGFTGGSANMGGSGYFDSMTGKGVAGPNFGFAEGGYPPVGQASLVGENGPELFVPGRQGAIVPNDIFAATRAALNKGGTSGAGAFEENAQALAVSSSYTRERVTEKERQTMLTGAGGSMLIQTEVINNVEYATVDQVAQAAAASAKQARAQVFADMRNKPSTRASLGMR